MSSSPPLADHDLHALFVASEMAKKGECKQRHGAVVYKRRNVLGVGFNKNKTHPKALRYYHFPFIHAELQAVLGLDSSLLVGSSLACVRINNRGQLMHSRPCCECIKMLTDLGIRYITYSTKDGVAKEYLSKNLR